MSRLPNINVRSKFNAFTIGTVAALAVLPLLAGTGVSHAASNTLSVSYTTTSQWDGGYVGDYTMKNTGSQSITGWTLQFALPAGEKVTSLWNGKMTVLGSRYTVKNDDWNGAVAPGATAEIGFQVSGTGATQPTNCRINGRSCGSSGGPTGTPTPPPTTTTTTAPPTSTPPTSTPATTTPVTTSSSTPSTTPTTMPSTTSATPTTTSATPIATGTPQPSAGGGFGAFSPFIDTSLYPAYDFGAATSAAGTKYFNLAFITDAGSCNPEWAGVTAVNDSGTTAAISSVRSAGGDVRVSFGGQAGNEMAIGCSSVSALAAAYQKVMDTLNVTYLDFDIEGGAITNTAANTRRNQALAQLQRAYAAKGKPLTVSYTLPVLPSGLTQDGVNVLTDAKSNNVTVSAVDIMAMDYGSYFSSDMGKDAVDAATATQAQVKSALGLSDSAAWSRVAVTPMIGVNDVQSETFTTTNASTLVQFAQSKHLAWLAFWSGARDKECSGGAKTYADPTCSSIAQQDYAFAKIFAGYTG